jgi:hypothetical protein
VAFYAVAVHLLLVKDTTGAGDVLCSTAKELGIPKKPTVLIGQTSYCANASRPDTAPCHTGVRIVSDCSIPCVRPWRRFVLRHVNKATLSLSRSEVGGFRALGKLGSSVFRLMPSLPRSNPRIQYVDRSMVVDCLNQ